MSESNSSPRFPSMPRVWWLWPLALGLLVRLPVLANDLVYDDHTLVTIHPHLAEPAFALKIPARDYGLEFGLRNRQGYYRPAFMLLNWALYQFAGPAPFAYHAASLMIFGAVIITVGACFRRLIPDARLALLAALVFALHPINTEVVVMFASLPDLVVQGLSAGVILLMLRDGDRDANPWLRGLAGFALAFMGALFKESAFVMLGLLAAGGVLLALCNRPRAARNLGAPLGMLVGLTFAFILRMQADLKATSPAALFAPFGTEGAGNAWLGFLTALSRLVFPREMIVLIDQRAGPWSGAGAAAVAAALGALAGIVWFASQRDGARALGLTWLAGSTYTLTLPLAIGLPYADRYFAAAPWIGMAAVGLGPPVRGMLARLLPKQRTRRLIMAGIAGLYLAMAGARSLTGNFKCQNPVVFWRSFLEDQPDSIYPRVGFAGVAFGELGDFDLAEKMAREVMAMAPESHLSGQMGLLLAEIRIMQGNFAPALEFLDWAESRTGNDTRGTALRAIALSGAGRSGEALGILDAAIKHTPDDARLRLQWVKIALATPEIPLETILIHAEACRKLGGHPPAEWLSMTTLIKSREEILNTAESHELETRDRR